jgi:hypothetical protein
VGVTEGGSSGAALLDENDLLVGVLSGGVGTNCNNFEWDEFAKIDPVWANLQAFLDPDATGAVWLAGKDHDETPVVPLGPAWLAALLVGLLLGAAGWAMRRPEHGA